MTDTTTLQTWLSQAETARHKLATGSKAEMVRHGDTETRFTAANLGDLETYIANLRSQLSASDGTPTTQRRPIYLSF